MRTQTIKTEGRLETQGSGATMKHDWLVENEDARKTLHDLYFETGSLPGQQPQVKAKEPENAEPVKQLTQSVNSGAVENEAFGNSVQAGNFTGTWVRRVAFVALALFVAFGVYRAIPRFEISTTKTEPHHTRSPLIREALERRQSAPPSPLPASAGPALGSLTVSPSMIMARYQPGQSSTQTLSIDNQTPNAVTFEMEAEDLGGDGEEMILVPAGDSSNSVAATAVFSQKYVRVEPMDRATVQVTLTWPASTTIRGVLARFRATDEIQLGGTGNMTASLGTLIVFARTQESGTQNPDVPLDPHPSQARFTISQWPMERSSAPAGLGNLSNSNNSKNVKSTNFAGLGENQ